MRKCLSLPSEEIALISTEDDVPLGEGSRRYYEEQFGDRIQRIKKGGSKTPFYDSSGSPHWLSRISYGRIALAAIIMHLIVTYVRTHSDPPSPNYMPPPQAQLDFGMHKPINDFRIPDDKEAEREVMEQLHELAEERKRPRIEPEDQEAAPEALLTADDVPLLEGLCYHLYHEGRQEQPTPSRRICQLLPPAAQQLVSKSARGEHLGDPEQTELIQALDALLHNADLYDAASFRKVAGLAEMVRLSRIGINPVQDVPRLNRLLLEMCYPLQIVGLGQRGERDEHVRAEMKKAAQLDLKHARMVYEGNEH